jgi:alpha-glucosidase
MASSLNLAPSVTPNIANPNAPDAQKLCPGYKAANVVNSDNTITADLSLAGLACNAYGNEIPDLVLEVQYQNAAQLNVKIYPKYIAPSNRSLYILDESLGPSGSISHGRLSGLMIRPSNFESSARRLARRFSTPTATKLCSKTNSWN